MMINMDGLVERIKQYQTLFAKQELFKCADLKKRCDEIIDVYQTATELGYKQEQKDDPILRAAETIKKTIEYNEEVRQKYPDALERIAQYQQSYKEKTLFKCNDVQAKAKEIHDVYHAAHYQGYKGTKEDNEINLHALLIGKPEILDEITRSFDEPIVD